MAVASLEMIKQLQTADRFGRADLSNLDMLRHPDAPAACTSNASRARGVKIKVEMSLMELEDEVAVFCIYK